MSVIPCEQNKAFLRQIREFAETLKTESHTLNTAGLSETDFYQSGLFRAAIERVRGQFSATMRGKREFVQHVLNHMQDQGFILDWDGAAQRNRHDYNVRMANGHAAVIELKGCLDGNNTNIFERPAHAHEFVIWSLCTNKGADPRRNAWSGIHTRLSAEIIDDGQPVDGVIIWDMVCGTIGRPCPKITGEGNEDRFTAAGPFKVPPPCIYVLPSTVPRATTNPNPMAQRIDQTPLLRAFHECFLGRDAEVNFVDFRAGVQGTATVRQTTIRRDGVVQKQSDMTPLSRG